MHQNNGDALVIKLGSASTTHHLQNVCDWEIHVTPRLAIEILRAFHHDQMSGEIHSPC